MQVQGLREQLTQTCPVCSACQRLSPDDCECGVSSRLDRDDHKDHTVGELQRSIFLLFMMEYGLYSYQLIEFVFPIFAYCAERLVPLPNHIHRSLEPVFQTKSSLLSPLKSPVVASVSPAPRLTGFA